jgi:hypothetical protein
MKFTTLESGFSNFRLHPTTTPVGKTLSPRVISSLDTEKRSFFGSPNGLCSQTDFVLIVKAYSRDPHIVISQGSD